MSDSDLQRSEERGPEGAPQPAPEPLGELHYRRLLVAVDGSPNSLLALSAAVTAARRDNAALTLICVVPDMAAEAGRWPWPAPCPPSLQAEVDASAERTLREAVARIPKDIPVTTIVRRGKPGPEIVAQARESSYDAILMGARGVSRVRALMGSVSQYVLNKAGVAVFVAHGPVSPESS
jgi:nucleotide-binding universal stress UspA family protein